MTGFDGDTFSQRHDGARLGTLLEQVKDLMADGEWRTLEEIRDTLGRGSEASISARLRDLRKPKFGAHETDRRRCGDPADGLWEYRVFINPNPPSADQLTTTTKTHWMKVAAEMADVIRKAEGEQSPEWRREAEGVLSRVEELRAVERAAEDADEDDLLAILDD